MTLVDVNVLVYAINRRDPRHEKARRWWEGALNGDDPIAVCWTVLTVLLRVITSPKALADRLPLADAIAEINGWVAHPNVQLLAESDRHWTTLSRLLTESGGIGNLITDAHLAALAIDTGCGLASFDTD